MIDDKEKTAQVYAPCAVSDSDDVCARSSAVEDCSTLEEYCQVYTNSDLAELVERFVPKRLDAELLAASYGRLHYEKKSSRVADCGTILSFRHALDVNTGEFSASGKLHTANFCKDRLCPMCSWRRSMKIFGQVSQIMDVIAEDYAFLFLTLTIPNVLGSELNDTIDNLMTAWKKFSRKKPFKTVVKGYFRALEITRNKVTSRYHPHFHVVLAVPKSYFTSRDYINRDEWLSMWQDACDDDTITQVDVRRAKGKRRKGESTEAQRLASAVAEIAKYAVKSSDYIFKNDETLTDNIVETLAAALCGRRLASFGGVFKDVAAQLNLDDAEDGDLTHINDTVNPDLAYLIIKYGWSTGAYTMTACFVECEIGGADNDVKAD